MDKYVNHSSVGTGHIGSLADPYSFADFITALSEPDIDFYMWGTVDADMSVTLPANHNYRSYLPSINGPWRIKTTGLTIYGNAESKELSGGVISVDGFAYIYSRTCINMAILATNQMYLLGGHLNCFGSLLHSISDILYGDSSNETYNHTDCILIAKSMQNYYSAPEAANFTNCAFNLIEGSDGDTIRVSNRTLTACQVGWSTYTIPAWDAAQDDWNTENIYTGLLEPPQPGNPPYTGYETDLWGNSRTGIGTGSMVDEVIPASVTVPPQGKSLVGMPGVNRNARAALNRDTKRGNPKGNAVENSSGDGVLHESKTQKMSKSRTLTNQSLPKGRLFGRT